MDKFRKELVEVIVAVETKDPRIDRIIQNIKGGFNKQLQFQYGEVLRRGKEAQAKRDETTGDAA